MQHTQQHFSVLYLRDAHAMAQPALTRATVGNDEHYLVRWDGRAQEPERPQPVTPPGLFAYHRASMQDVFRPLHHCPAQRPLPLSGHAMMHVRLQSYPFGNSLRISGFCCVKTTLPPLARLASITQSVFVDSQPVRSDERCQTRLPDQALDFPGRWQHQRDTSQECRWQNRLLRQHLC